jgi:ADP-ribosylglycohydrolase
MKTTHSKVMTIANKLVRDGYNRANAMVKAWVLVRMPLVETKVSGTTFGKRQKAIAHLSRYAPERISISLVREAGNEHDKNAVAVYAQVEGKGSYCMGYLPKSLAAFIAPLMDAGKGVRSAYKEVRGMYQPYMNFGLVIALEV